ncbi:mandelate racemase/muconate lactonizing enzyme family protein [Bacillus canaveralius]|uniref:Mandelate racemase/muconate lactonizing enzyme family protein n=1 Tax=Bacillus canaveralius TaxID=1403243 RepID=A0A2N5GHN6_9BACI|nr:mandelate racemase/muconate lactonizing enzyme family protein [Bacillus canaveralius]PLR80316.1 mandelate racemase/muconate lactonizing enzyme family protein [Bacillus canaveralius]PLR95465.1 mandelate racemase/muconate lactonizing enzyme family protein [Bacillus canaveralius]RSK44040.1 mandelate racemase/muconate lactonizing enzyme family protein [Bacillus canaveralius]
MQIKKIETFPLLYKISQPYGDANGYKNYRTCYLIHIITDSGVDGWGECIDWLPALHLGFKERITPYLIGKSVYHRLQLVNTIKKWHQRAATAVSMALTEIAAKSANLSVCELWGGSYRNSVPVYASFQSYTDRKDWINHSLQYIEQTITQGFNKIKVKIGGRTLQEDESHIHSLQDMIEGKLPIIIDANQSYDLATARKWERHFSKWSNVLWFEEPLPLDNMAELKLLRTLLSVPIGAGENIKGAKQFVPFLCENALDIIQPDLMHANGIDDFRDTLQLARHFGTRVSPHAYDGALSRLYTIFSQSCLSPSSKMDETDIEPIEWDVMENAFSELINIHPSNGIVQIPSGIGIGVNINQELISRYLWDGSSYW